MVVNVLTWRSSFCSTPMLQGLPANWRWMVGAPVVPALLLSCEPPLQRAKCSSTLTWPLPDAWQLA